MYHKRNRESTKFISKTQKHETHGILFLGTMNFHVRSLTKECHLEGSPVLTLANSPADPSPPSAHPDCWQVNQVVLDLPEEYMHQQNIPKWPLSSMWQRRIVFPSPTQIMPLKSAEIAGFIFAWEKMQPLH